LGLYEQIIKRARNITNKKPKIPWAQIYSIPIDLQFFVMILSVNDSKKEITSGGLINGKAI